MRKLLTRALALGCIAALNLAACGDDEDDGGGAGRGGSAGTGGRGGGAGTGGSSGTGGAAGTAGTGGAAGTSGSGGAAGSAGSAGASGSGGSAGSDAGSDAGPRAQVIPCPESPAVTIKTTGNGPGSFAFSPSTATIQAGEVVRFQNQTNIVHTATSGTGGVDPGVPDGVWDTGNLAENTARCVRINVPGSYPFYCTPHPEAMTGTITVE